MNIALLSIEYPPHVNGGLGRYTKYYTRYLAKKDNKIRVYTLNPGDLPFEEYEPYITVFRPFRKTLMKLTNRCKGIYGFEFLLRVVRLMVYNLDAYRLVQDHHRHERFDIIAVQDWMSGLTGILCTLFLHIPVVFHVQNTEFTMTPWGKRTDPLRFIAITERILAKRAQKVIVPSKSMFNLVTSHGWNPKKIAVIHHGYESSIHIHEDESSITKIKSQIRMLCKIAPQDKILLFAGRLSYAKGIFQLIEAMATVFQKKPDTKLIVIGTGNNRAIELLIQKLHLTENIFAYYRFLDFNRLAEHYQAADICIFPSIYESFGLVALETMSLGKPVILGDGFPDVFAGTDTNPTALFVDSKVPKMIANAILELLQDPARAVRMGEAARSFVQSNFSWNQTFDETLKVYHEVIGNSVLK